MLTFDRPKSATVMQDERADVTAGVTPSQTMI